MTTFDGITYLSPRQASARLHISSKTLQRWAEDQKIIIWTGKAGSRKRKQIKFKLDWFQAPTGYRYYSQNSIEKLAVKLNIKPSC